MSESAGSVSAMVSPCIGICTLGPGRLCIGCFRSAEEIGSWREISQARRRVIMEELPLRAQRLFDE